MPLPKEKADWDELAALDPLWAILSDPRRRFGKWELEEFFRTGEEEVMELLAAAEALGHPERRDTALDVGCGVGRVTRALAGRFAQCTGVDISPEMIARARELNRDVPNCTFILSEAPDLAMFEGRFDLVYSRLVLQHLAQADDIRRSIAEFVRVLRVGGLLVFQLPGDLPWKRRIQPRRRLYGWLRAVGFPATFLYGHLGLSPMRLRGLPEGEVLAVLGRLGARVLEVRQDELAGPGVPSRTYYVTR